MSTEKCFEFHIPTEFVYDGMVMRAEVNPKHILDRVKELNFTSEDVLLASYCKTGMCLHRIGQCLGSLKSTGIYSTYCCLCEINR